MFRDVCIKLVSYLIDFGVDRESKFDRGKHKGCLHRGEGRGLATMQSEMDRGGKGLSCKWTSFSVSSL